MEAWQLFQDARFALRFKYPRLSSDGEPVDRVETEQDGILRVHFLSPRSREVYFEVTKYGLLTARSEYQRHKEYLPKQLDVFDISELRETVCATLPAHEYSFGWDQGRRTVILVERDDASYRLLYNPSSAVNLQILSTVQWVGHP